MYPLRPRHSMRTVIFVLCLIWFTSFAVGLPGLLYGNVIQATNQTWAGKNISRHSPSQWKRKCHFDWPHTYSGKVLFLLMYAIPLAFLTITYILIASRLWFHRQIGEVTRAQVESANSKRRAVKIMLVVMLIFAVCWLPYQLFFILLQLKPEWMDLPAIPMVFIACYWLAMSNAAFNPLIYFTMNRRFRNGLINLVKRKRHRRVRTRQFTEPCDKEDSDFKTTATGKIQSNTIIYHTK